MRQDVAGRCVVPVPRVGAYRRDFFLLRFKAEIKKSRQFYLNTRPRGDISVWEEIEGVDLIIYLGHPELTLGVSSGAAGNGFVGDPLVHLVDDLARGQKMAELA